MPRHAFARGISLLLVDLPGQGATARKSKLLARHDQEFPISSCVDYLLARGDVDEDRIVLYGDGFGGSYASRAASLDHQFAAAVCDGGIWDQHERSFLIGWLTGDDTELNKRATEHFVGLNIKCPFLVAVGEHDFLDATTALELYKSYLKSNARIDLRIFSAEETGASHGQGDNPTLGKEFIFDWIASTIGAL